MKTAMNTNARTNLPATGKGFGIKSKSAGKIIGLLTSLYSSPVTPVRELIVNAVEAKHESGSQRPVEVTINTEKSVVSDNILGNINGKATISSATFTIRDYGTGMDSKMFHDVFLNIAESTKDTSDETVGGFGIGAKAVFMLTDTVTYTSTKDGETTRSIVSLNSQGTEDNTISQATDLPNGTTITFDLDGEKARSVIDRIGAEFLDYQNPSDVLVTLDGKDVEVGKKGTYDLKHGEVSSNSIEFSPFYKFDKTVITIIGKGGIAYQYPVYKFDDLVSQELEGISNGLELSTIKQMLGNTFNGNVSKVALRIDLTRDHINPSRESCISSETLDKMCAKVFAEYMNDFVNETLSDLQNAKTPKQWRKAVANIENNNMKNYVSSSIGELMGIFPIGDNGSYSGNMEDLYENENRLRVLYHPEVLSREAIRYRYGNDPHFTASMKSILVPDNEKSIYLNHFIENFDLNGDFHYDVVIEGIMKNDFYTAASHRGSFVAYPNFVRSPKYKDYSIFDMFKLLFDVETVDSFQDVREKAMKLGREDYKEKGFAKRGNGSKARKTQDSVDVIYGGKSYTFDTIGKAIDSVEEYAKNVDDVTLFVVENEEMSKDDTYYAVFEEVLERTTGYYPNIVAIVSKNISRRVTSSVSRRKDVRFTISQQILSSIYLSKMEGKAERIGSRVASAAVNVLLGNAAGFHNPQSFFRIYKSFKKVSDEVSRVAGTDSYLYEWVDSKLEDHKEVVSILENVMGDTSELESNIFDDLFERETASIVREAPIYGYTGSYRTSIISLHDLASPTTLPYGLYGDSLDDVIRYIDSVNKFAANTLPKGNIK